MINQSTCMIHLCENSITHKYYCEKHHKIYKKHGSNGYMLKNNPHFCCVKDCKREYKSLGYCQFHGFRVRKYGDPLKVVYGGTTHGMTGTPEHRIWLGMLNRCSNPAPRKQYKNYYGKGIRVCDRWKKDFMNFYNDMGSKPDGMSLDRIDGSGDYSPSNCRWATYQQQAANKGLGIRNKTGYKGVIKRNNRWEAKLIVDGKYKYLGSFKNIKDAALAYNKAASDAWGEFASLNTID